MTDLHTLQNSFQNYLLSGHSDIYQSVVATSKIPIAMRLGIYREAYQARLLEALGNNYPCLKTYLGDEPFQKIGFDYLATHSSTFRSIRWFGDEFALYLSQHNSVSYYPFLAELAEFEWKMTLTFDAKDSHLFTMEEMAIVPHDAWNDMVIIAHPSLQRMNFNWTVTTLWQNITNKESLESPMKQSAPTPWVLWRRDYTNRFYAMSVDEAWAIDQVLSGATFGKLCEGLCSFIAEQDVGMRAASLLKSWIQSGLLTGIILP
jgi:hypothetical protein